ncbi:MAG: EF-P lysine aminoacylase EpmA [Kofleriaceae bacterium]
MTRGRVIAVDGDIAVVRGARGATDRVMPADPAWRPGDIIDGDRVVHRFAGDAYPEPSTEVARMPPARIAMLHARATALSAVRAFFATRDFLEVETPLLVPSPGLEIHLDAVPAGSGYLITSPEYQMKRLLAAGFERIYQVCKCFRGNEEGAHHASEFSMIEWYRAYDELESIIRDTEELVCAVVTALAGSPIARVIDANGTSARGTSAHGTSAHGTSAHGASGDARVREIDVTPPWPRMTVRHAMTRFAGIDVDGDEPAGALVAKVRAAGIDVADGTAWDDAFFAAFLARVEPAIGAMDRPLILHDWPAPLAALAKRSASDPRVALRFEAYVGGIELANAFGELTDPIEQRARFLDDQRIRRERGREVYPIDEKLLAALAEGLPPSAGIALGFDRLVMLATGAAHIDEVLTFSAAEL